jgi:predicted  nucleic acid-binding Zn-ribbon protein
MELVEKLKALAKLQRIDTRLDRLRSIRGGLPEEVNDLEDELEGLRTRRDRYQQEISAFQEEIRKRETVIEESRMAIARYESQLMEVKNNREYEAINKEIELAQLDIQTSERKIRQFSESIGERMARVEEVNRILAERSADLEEKKNELDQLVEETRKEEDELAKLAQAAKAHIDERLLRAYERIRNNMRNGLAVVTVDRGACGGCFAIIPPQRQCEIRQSRKLIVCENCGRILVAEELFEPLAQPDEQPA